MTSPLIGIALAAYQPPVDFLEAQLGSIAAQTYPNWFCVVSFDSPMEPLRAEPRLRRFFDDPRFEFHQNPSAFGSTENFEVAGQLCLRRSPKYLAYSDQDDVWYPEKLTILERELSVLGPLSLVHCDMHLLMRRPNGAFERDGRTAWEAERRGVHHVSPLDFFVRNIAAGAGMLLDADLVRMYPKIPADAYGHDHWYALVASYFGGVHPVPQPLYDYRIHGANVAGLSEYKSFFAASASSAKLGILKKCMHTFNSSRARAEQALAYGLPVSVSDRVVAASFADLGLGYLLKALFAAGDKALIRSCLVRAFGKCLRIFQPHYKAYSAR